MRKLCCVLLGISLASSTIAGVPSSNKTTQMNDKTTAWKPTVFDISATQLQPNYQGTEPKKFFEIYEQKLNLLSKDDFETSVEYARRTADKNALLFPINTRNSYAFRITKINFKYDADKQVYYAPRDKPRYQCLQPTSLDKWLMCGIASNSIWNENNKTVYLTIFQLAIVNHSQLLNIAFYQRPSPTSVETFNAWVDDPLATFIGSINVPLKNARLLKDKTITVLFVGHVTDAIDLTSSEKGINLITVNQSVPFRVQKIIYYVLETGEILDSVDVPY